MFFDLDDTLCAYWDAARKGLREAFLKCGPEGWTPDRMAEFWAAAFREFYPRLKAEGWYEAYLRSGETSRTELMRRALLLAGVNDADLARVIGDAYAEERLRALKLFSGALDLLDLLHGRVFLGLITNGPADVQRDEIETLGIGPLFDSVLIEGELGFGKPSPEVFRHAEESCGFSGREVLFVGNSYAHDVRPALEFGWRAVWLRRKEDVPPSSDGERSAKEQMPEGAPKPDAIVASLHELRQLLERASVG